MDRAPTLNRVVVGVDFNVASATAATWTARWLVREAEIVLVHAVDARGEGQPHSRPGMSAAAQLEQRSVERQLATLSRGLAADFVWCEVRNGDAADAMLAAAVEFRADLVVVGAPDASRLSRDEDGSTVASLVGRADVPVVVAKGPLERHPHRILVVTSDGTTSSEAVICARALGESYDADVSVRSWRIPRSAELAPPRVSSVPNAFSRRAVGRSQAEYVPSDRFQPAFEFDRGARLALWPEWPHDLAGSTNETNRTDIDLVVMSADVPADLGVIETVCRAPCPVVFVPNGKTDRAPDAWVGRA